MPSSRKLHIASLGSSYAAGPDIAPQIQPFAAERSGQNYAHLLAQKLDAKITDLSFSGSTLLNITKKPQTVGDEVFPPQIDGLPEDVDIITITSGGNDINYIGQLFHDAEAASQPGRDKRYDSWEHSPVPDRLNGLTQEDLNNRFIEVIDAVHAKAPNARIYLVEYLALLGSNTSPVHDIPFTIGTIMYHSHVAYRLHRACCVAAWNRPEWCERVPVYVESFCGHALGSKKPWVEGYGKTSGPVLHPNLKGMKAIARRLFSRVRKNLQ